MASVAITREVEDGWIRLSAGLVVVVGWDMSAFGGEEVAC